jgi:hypothetical protein
MKSFASGASFGPEYAEKGALQPFSAANVARALPAPLAARRGEKAGKEQKCKKHIAKSMAHPIIPIDRSKDHNQSATILIHNSNINRYEAIHEGQSHPGS